MAISTTKKIRRPFSGVKFMEILLGLFFIVVIGVLLLGFYPVSHPRLTKKVVELIRHEGIDSCSISNVTVAVWKGVSFHDVYLTGRTSAGDSYTVKMPIALVRCNIFMLAVKFRNIKKLIAAEFGGHKKEDGNDPSRIIKSVLRIVGASRYIKGASLFRTDVSIEKKNSVSLRANGFGMNVVFPQDEGDRFSGSFAITGLVYSQIDIARQVSVDFSYDNGTIALSRCKVKAFDGRIKFETRLNLEKRTLSALTCSIANLDLSAWSRFSDSGAGRLAGRADLKFTLDSSALRGDSLQGKGALSVSRFEVVGFPFQRSLVTMLMYPGLAHLNFRKFRTSLTLKPGWLFETDATGEGDTLSVKFDGWIRTDGLLNEKLECMLTKAGVATLPDFAQKTLEDAPGGGRALKCRVYGMIQNPKVSVESQIILQKAVKNMFEEVKNNLQLWMR